MSDIPIRHKVGWCPVCGSPILDCGYCDDPELWEHAWTPVSGLRQPHPGFP